MTHPHGVLLNSALGRVLSRLECVEPSSSGWTARCPAHRDLNPSLSISIGEAGRVLLYCHAGCQLDAIVEKLGISVTDLYPRIGMGRRDRHNQEVVVLNPCQTIPGPSASPDQEWVMGFYEPLLAPEHVSALASHLGLPEFAFREFRLGYSGCELAWMIAEMDARGRVIGVVRRFLDGQQRSLPGHRRGLVIPRNVFGRPDPLLIVEGFSDTVAATSLNIAAIGRPSCSGGVELLAELLAGHPREVRVCGENDQKPDGRWPGLTGTREVAERLTRMLGWPVAMAMPPEGCKDFREYAHRVQQGGTFHV